MVLAGQPVGTELKLVASKDRSQQTRRTERAGLEAENWELGCGGEDGDEGVLGLRRALGRPVGLRQEIIWDKGLWKDSGTEGLKVAFSSLA